MKKNKSTIILILVFFVGLSVMLYPTISDYVNQLHQTRAVATYAEDVDKLTDADYSAYFEAADAFNAQIAADPDALYFPQRFPTYESTLALIPRICCPAQSSVSTRLSAKQPTMLSSIPPAC